MSSPSSGIDAHIHLVREDRLTVAFNGTVTRMFLIDEWQQLFRGTAFAAANRLKNCVMLSFFHGIPSV